MEEGGGVDCGEVAAEGVEGIGVGVGVKEGLEEGLGGR